MEPRKNILLEPLLNVEGFKSIKNSLEEGKVPVLATGVLDSQKCHIIASLKEKVKRPVLVITNSELKAKEIQEDLKFFFKNTSKVLMYPAKDIIFYSADVRSTDIVRQRFEVLNSLLEKENPVIVLSIEALFDRLTPKDKFENFIIEIKEGDELPLDEISKKLIFMGYERRELVEASGQFAVRGGIIDIFSSINSNPVRIEYFGDEIDSIRLLDTSSQRSIEKVDYIKIFPMRELVYGDEELEEAVAQVKKEYSKTVAIYEKKGLLEEQKTLKNNILEALEKLKENKSMPSIENFFQYFYKEETTLLDYLKKDTIIYFDEPARVKKRAENSYLEFNESVKSRILKGYMLPLQINMVFSYAKILAMCDKFSQVLFSSLTQSVNDFKVKSIVDFKVKGTSVFKGKFDLLRDELIYWREREVKVIILAGTRTRGERLVKELLEQNISAKYIESLYDYTLKPETVFIISGSLNKGFEYIEEKFAIVSDKELFGEDKNKTTKKKKSKKGAKIESFTDLRIGDYIVHDNHGIGIYRGIETIVSDNINRDYLKIAYHDGGSLYIPTNQMDMIQKYIGGDSVKPKITKLGGSDWNKAKARTRGAVKILAKDLVELYAKRRDTKGFQYSKDTVWQAEFESMFPYEETNDQIVAIEDVKKDMESTKVMDRLICGDVGYGKTEVAIRAAFKALQDNKQVAYLVPTTVLAQQHYNTFVQRMKDFPIKIEVLSRFRTKKQQKETLESLKSGKSDIVIGTHRILSKDVEFKDIGIIIVDEEQRFGVSHKEKLKRIKENIDVLTLTATPIPRTLHMSLTGIRDISILEEPPQERQPIQTYVMEYNTEFIRDAVHRELARGGQVYYLYNRVKNIDEVANKIQTLAPEANVSFIHGQMSETELESIMLEFIRGEINVLVCTTIIETGLDIPNVNTIIIQEADTMGLSQLYQLRGRVGRSNRIAYSYLMYKKDKVLDEVAEKRLQTIKDFTEFGSGFKIAMRDLEIRGAGNLLGEQQHGHMDTVGYDMYCRLLDEAVRELSGEIIEEIIETTIDIKISAYIPSYYIPSEVQKLEIYKKISFIKTKEDYYDIQEEIEDRFGDLPKNVQSLLDIALLKAVANNLGVVSIVQKQLNIIITFKADAKVEPEKLTSIINKYSNRLLFTAAQNPYITYISKDNIVNNDIIVLRDILKDLK